MGKTIGNYLQLDLIGQGTYGKVYKGKDERTGDFVAIKVVSSIKLTSQKLVDNLQQEIEIMKSIKHPNIVNLLDVIKTKDETYLIMEFCKGGDFAQFMKKKRRLSEEQAKLFLQQLAAALEFMRARKLIHRDLKPSNILLVSKDDDRSQIKVADFGYARYIEPQDLAETACGTPLYMAPEVLSSRQKYDSKADLWSVGCILYEMVVGKVPFTAPSQVSLYEKIMTQPVSFPKDLSISRSLQELLAGLLKVNPTHRMTFEEFFMHPFLDFDNYPRANPFASEPFDIQRPTPTPYDDDKEIQRVIQEAMSSLIISREPSEEQEAEQGDGEPSFYAKGGAPSGSGSNMAGSGSLSRPKTNPYRNMNASSTQDDEYIMVNSATVEINAFADVLSKAQAPGPAASVSSSPPPLSSPSSSSKPSSSSNPSAFPRTILSESPPLPIVANSPQFASPSSSPSVGSALSRALATATSKLLWSLSSSTPEEQSARDILSHLNSLSYSSSDEDERALWKSITTSARRAYAVVELARLKLSTDSNSPPEKSKEELLYIACILFLKALSIIQMAMSHARHFWQNKGQTINPAINDVVQFLREKYNECLDEAERLERELQRTAPKLSERLLTPRLHVDQARALFDRARELGKEAGIEEVLGNLAISEGFYMKALLLFEALISKDVPEREVLNDSDREIIREYASSTLKRLKMLQKRNQAPGAPKAPAG